MKTATSGERENLMERIYHTWDEWECYPAGFYETRPPREGMTDDECRDAYASFLADDDQFREALDGVLRDWPNSCEHYLSNERMNRVAWLGQAAMCYATGVGRQYRSGYNRLTKRQQAAADATALEYLNAWLVSRSEPALDAGAAASKTVMDLY